MQVIDRIEGMKGHHMPWKGTLAPAVRRQVGVFKDSVLQLLARDADERPSMAAFCKSCDRVLSGSTTVRL